MVLEIVDSNQNYHGKEIFGHKVIAPEKLKALPPRPIYLSTLAANHAIRQQLKGMGIDWPTFDI